MASDETESKLFGEALQNNYHYVQFNVNHPSIRDFCFVAGEKLLKRVNISAQNVYGFPTTALSFFTQPAKKEIQLKLAPNDGTDYFVDCVTHYYHHRLSKEDQKKF